MALKLGLTTEEKYEAYLKLSHSLKDEESHYVFWPLMAGGLEEETSIEESLFVAKRRALPLFEFLDVVPIDRIASLC